MAQPQARSRRPLLFGALAAVTLYTLYHLSSTESAQSIRSTLFSTPSSTSSTFDLPEPPLEHGVDARLEWDNGPVPQTRIVRQAKGWNIIDRMYAVNGTFFIVTEKPEDFPPIRLMVSSGYEVYNGEEEVKKREPSDKDMQIITPRRAKALFGTFANRLDGVSLVNNDPPQFIKHYYHFAAELFFGLWRTYASLDTRIDEDAITSLPAPRRLIFTKADEWRDYAKMNQYIMDSAFPSASVENSRDWDERASTHHVYVFDRIVLGDRAAAMRGETFVATGRTASEAFTLPSSRSWWSPIRANVLEFSNLNRTAGSGTMDRPVITYISRQNWGRRMLIPADHDGLVKALKELEERYGYEVNIVDMDKMSREEQLRLAGRTTIMLGVHGNGLTSLLWMNPTPRSTVIEFFYPGGFAFDYEWTTRALGMIHVGFWGSDSFTSPKLPPVNYPEGFQGNSIPINGQKVADLIHHRLSLEEEADD